MDIPTEYQARVSTLSLEVQKKVNLTCFHLQNTSYGIPVDVRHNMCYYHSALHVGVREGDCRQHGKKKLEHC